MSITTVPGAEALTEAQAGKAETAIELLQLHVERMESFARLMTVGVEHIGNDQENTIESLLGLNHQMVLDLQSLIQRVVAERAA